MNSKSKLFRVLIGVAGFTTIPTFTLAATLQTISQSDFNGNGIIEPGAEQKSVIRIWDRLSDHQQDLILYREEFQSGGSGIPVASFDDSGEIAAREDRCKKKQKFFFRDRMANITVLESGFVGSAGNAASFSVTGNQINNVVSWNLNGAVTWVFGDRCRDRPEGYSPTQLYLSGYAFAPFLEFKGKGSSSNKGLSSLRGGVYSEFQLLSGRLFNVQHLSIEPYYQTDFSFDANIYGLRVNWSPVNLDARLNGYIGANKPLRYWWSFDGVADYLSVDNAGRTRFASGTEYGWVGARIGVNLEYFPENFNGFYANAQFETFYDVINGNSANLFSSEIGLYLNQSGNSSVSVVYDNGMDYQTLNSTHQVVLKLKFSY